MSDEDLAVHLRGHYYDGVYWVRLTDVVTLLETNDVLPQNVALMKAKIG